MARTLLEDAINGHKLVLKELDEYLSEGPEEGTKLNAEDYHVTIDLKGILPDKKQPEDLDSENNGKEIKQCQVLFDILDVGVDADIIEDIVKHPVITTIILKKWEKTRKFYYFTTALYFFFLASYSLLIYDLFGPHGRDKFDGTYYKRVCNGSLEKYKDEMKDLTACQFRDPICNKGKY